MKPKIGDFIIGTSPKGEVVIGPVIALDEKQEIAVVGPWQQNSSGATFSSCEVYPPTKAPGKPPETSGQGPKK